MEVNLKIEPTSVWDAGAMGCGELIVLLRERILALEPGQVLRVIARDPGAPEDLPAWSDLTATRSSPPRTLSMTSPANP